MPGIRWRRDPSAPNSRGYYSGPDEAITEVARILESAGIVAVRDERPDITLPYIPHSHLDLDDALYDYQRIGVEWCVDQLSRTGGALLADDRGLGKSPQAIAVADELAHNAPVIIVAPAVVVPKWRREVTRWSKHDPGRFAIYGYESFQKALKIAAGAKPDKKLAPLPSSPGMLVLDEAHYICNSRAIRSKVIHNYRTSVENLPTLALTGTPMTARPRDLWHLLHTLHPGRWGSFFSFARRYCNGGYVEIPGLDMPVFQSDGISNADELHRRLSHVMLRRTKSMVSLQLPGRTRSIVPVELPPAARKRLEQARAAMMQNVDVLRSTGRNSGVAALLSNVEEYKIKSAISLALDIVSDSGNCILVCTRTATADAIGKALNCPVVHGENTAPHEREAILQSTNLAVATMYSIETGIDLVNYSHMIFVGLDWLPKTLLQTEDRIHRVGQSKPVTFYYLVGSGSIDEIVQNTVISRLAREDSILGSGDSGLKTDLTGGTDADILNSLIDSLIAA